MYKEITPFYPVFNPKSTKTEDLFSPAEPRLLRLDTIRQGVPQVNEELVRLVFSDDHFEDILIKKEEYEDIKKYLLKNTPDISKELSGLTNAIRDLWNLLRARLH